MRLLAFPRRPDTCVLAWMRPPRFRTEYSRWIRRNALALRHLAIEMRVDLAFVPGDSAPAG
jgi:hypothetical protein